jgi:hypothetical protein
MTRLVIVVLFAALLGCGMLAYQSVGGYPCSTSDFTCQYKKMAKSIRNLY